MVRAAPALPTPLEDLDTVLEALGDISLTPRRRREGHRLAPPSKVDKISQQIMILMGPNPLYDNLSTLFATYEEL